MTQLTTLLIEITENNILHAKWLNSLSYLENCGARKIAACEHPTLVEEEMLKHASEEFRHSHYLKKQIKRVFDFGFANYSSSSILGGVHTRQYLNKLDLFASRFLLQSCHLPYTEIKKSAYLLVTYAIEIRAQELYPIYEKVLRECQSKVFVNSIIQEEKEHLFEMQEGIESLPHGWTYAEHICNFEQQLFCEWLDQISLEISDQKALCQST